MPDPSANLSLVCKLDNFTQTMLQRELTTGQGEPNLSSTWTRTSSCQRTDERIGVWSGTYVSTISRHNLSATTPATRTFVSKTTFTRSG